MKQLNAAKKVLDEHRPDKVAVFGGDCLSTEGRFAYLNEAYNGQLAILWVDAHSDIKNLSEWRNAHRMVLANPLGEGDEELVAYVKVHIEPKRVRFAGLRQDGLTEQESGFIDRHQLQIAPPAALMSSSEPVLKHTDIKQLAVHFDLDVFDPNKFRSTFFGEPESERDPYAAYPAGKMDPSHVVRLMNDVSKAARCGRSRDHSASALGRSFPEEDAVTDTNPHVAALRIP